MSNNSNQLFEEFIKQLENPDSNYPWVTRDLPENPSAVDKFKFDVCQRIANYKLQNKLTVEELAKRIHLDIDRNAESHREKLQKDTIQKVLFCWTDDFSIESLIDYIEQLSLEIKLEWAPKSNKTPENYQGEWDKSLNDQKILEIIQAKVNNKIIEPLPEPVLLWKKEVYYFETTYRGVKYRIIFWIGKEGELFMRNIWVVE